MTPSDQRAKRFYSPVLYCIYYSPDEGEAWDVSAKKFQLGNGRSALQIRI